MNGDLIKLVEETNNDTKEVVLSEAYQLFESQMMDLAEKYKNGEITTEEYQVALEGFLGDIWKKISGKNSIEEPKKKNRSLITKAERKAEKDEFKSLTAKKLADTQKDGVRPGVIRKPKTT